MLRAGEPTLAVICIALFGLVVSPVSWSHHWVWMLPTVVVTAVLAWRRRNVVMAAVSAAGVALMVWTPIDLMPKHHEVDRAAVASARRSVLSVVGAGDPGRRRSHHCRRRRYRARTPAIDCAGAGIRGQLIGYPAAVCGIRDDDCWPDGAEPLPFLSVAA